MELMSYLIKREERMEQETSDSIIPSKVMSLMGDLTTVKSNYQSREINCLEIIP